MLPRLPCAEQPGLHLKTQNLLVILIHCLGVGQGVEQPQVILQVDVLELSLSDGKP